MTGGGFSNAYTPQVSSFPSDLDPKLGKRQFVDLDTLDLAITRNWGPSDALPESFNITGLDGTSNDKNSIFDLPSTIWAVKPYSSPTENHGSINRNSFFEEDHSFRYKDNHEDRNNIFDTPSSPTKYASPTKTSNPSASKHAMPVKSRANSPISVPVFTNKSLRPMTPVIVNSPRISSPTQKTRMRSSSHLSPLDKSTKSFDLSKDKKLRGSAHFVPLSKNLLGSGLHSNVYRGTYLVHKRSLDPEESSSTTRNESNLKSEQPLSRLRSLSRHNVNGPNRLLLNELQCAVKVLNNNPESQMAGLKEAALLQHCAHAQILEIHDLVDISNPNGITTTSTTCAPLSMHNLTYPPSQALLESSCTCGKLHPKDSVPNYALVLELCPHGTLWHYMQKHTNQIGHRKWMRWARQLASAVSHLHSNRVVHHDIKPHNILLDEFLGVKLSDLGEAEMIPESGYFVDGIGKGTYAYLAPELLDAHTYNSAIDIYSVGTTMFTVGILGKEPYSGITGVQQMIAIQRGFLSWPGNWPDPHLHSQLADASGDPDTRGLRFGGRPISSTSLVKLSECTDQLPDAFPRYIRFLNGDLIHRCIWTILSQCLSVDPSDRPTAQELVLQLKSADGVDLDTIW